MLWHMLNNNHGHGKVLWQFFDNTLNGLRAAGRSTYDHHIILPLADKPMLNRSGKGFICCKGCRVDFGGFLNDFYQIIITCSTAFPASRLIYKIKCTSLQGFKNLRAILFQCADQHNRRRH